MFLVNPHATGVTHVGTAFGDSVKEHLLVHSAYWVYQSCGVGTTVLHPVIQHQGMHLRGIHVFFLVSVCSLFP